MARAIADYILAISIDSERASAYYNRGLSEFELNDKKGAIFRYAASSKSIDSTRQGQNL
jgi:hypothetical protein